MNKTSFAAIAIALTSLAAGQAMAAKAPYISESNLAPLAAFNTVTSTKSRADVRAELAAAQRSGDIVATKSVDSESSIATGTLLKDQSPSQYAAQPAVAGKSRDQVRAELASARTATSSLEYSQIW